MATTKVTITLRGEATRNGTIELTRFAKFSADFQTVINRIEYALRKEDNRSPGFNPKVQKNSLRLVATGGGSFSAALEVVEPEQQSYEANMSAQALEYLVAGMQGLPSTSVSLPVGYDQGVLISIQEMGSILKHQIDEIELNLDAPTRHQTVVYDQPLRAQVNHLLTEHEERIDLVHGRLLQVSFTSDTAERYKCRLYQTHRSYTTCTFDDDVADQIQGALRQSVSAIGIATVDPLTDTISKLHIKQLVIFGDNLAVSERDAADALNEYRAANDTLAKLRRGLYEAMQGKTHPIASLWDAFDDE